MSEDIKVTDGTILEALNNKVDLDGGNYKGSELEAYIHEHCGGGSGFNLFDTKIADHILEGEEALGWALQGTYVTKESYPDFYSSCLEQKNAGVESQVMLGESILTMFVNENGHQFYNIADKPSIDAFYDTYGIADFYGIDEENERVFLPRNNQNKRILIDKKEATETDSTWYNLYSDGWLEQGGNATASGGSATVELLKPYARLDFVVSTAPLGGSVSNQAFVFKTIYNSTSNFTTQWHGASSNPTYISWRTAGYAANAIDLPERYTYYCVGNTEVTQAITNVTEVTTSENDTIPLFTGMYFDFKPNNVSWLKAGEQQNGGGVYKTCYDQLVEIVNGVNNYDLKVINKADMVSGVVYDEYWILDQDNLTFRTPLTIATKSLSGGVVGNSISLGLTDGTTNVAIYEGTTSNQTYLNASNVGYGTVVGSSGTGTDLNNGKTLGVTTDSTKSGIVAEQSTAQLYFKVANAVQNIELLDAGRVMEEAVLRSSLKEVSVVIEDYQNGSSWYRIWSPNSQGKKRLEQGGNSGCGDVIVSLLKEYSHNDYIVIPSIQAPSKTDVYAVNIKSKTNSFFTAYISTSYSSFDWYACGYIE